MRSFVVMISILALACQKTGKEAPKTQTANSAAGAPGPSMPQMRVGSAAFHLEIGAVYERFQDLKTAAEHFSQAAQSAENAMQRVQAYSALGRTKEASGDKEGAVSSFQQALAETEKSKSAGPSMGPGFGMLGGDDVAGRLARLYVERGRYEDADRLCEGQLAAATDPWRREQLYRLQVEIYAKLGTLDKKIAEKEKAAEQTPPDESALRFLAVAFGGGGMMAPSMPGGQPGPQQIDVSKQVGVYERLCRLHPDDMQVRQTLQALLERTGRIEDAVKLVVAAPTSARAECPGGYAPLATSPALNAAAEAIRIRLRAGQGDAALAETAKLAALSTREGGAANLLAAQLYLDQGKTDQASQMIKQAGQHARSREDQRQVAFAREQALARSGGAAELKPLYAEWQKSDDPCLRMAAKQREQQPSIMMAGPPMPRPPTLRP